MKIVECYCRVLWYKRSWGSCHWRVGNSKWPETWDTRDNNPGSLRDPFVKTSHLENPLTRNCFVESCMPVHFKRTWHYSPSKRRLWSVIEDLHSLVDRKLESLLPGNVSIWADLYISPVQFIFLFEIFHLVFHLEPCIKRRTCISWMTLFRQWMHTWGNTCSTIASWGSWKTNHVCWSLISSSSFGLPTESSFSTTSVSSDVHEFSHTELVSFNAITSFTATSAMDFLDSNYNAISRFWTDFNQIVCSLIFLCLKPKWGIPSFLRASFPFGLFNPHWRMKIHSLRFVGLANIHICRQWWRLLVIWLPVNFSNLQIHSF